MRVELENCGCRRTFSISEFEELHLRKYAIRTGHLGLVKVVAVVAAIVGRDNAG